MRSLLLPLFASLGLLVGCGPTTQAGDEQACIEQTTFEVDPASYWLAPSSTSPCERTALVPKGGLTASEITWLPAKQKGLFYFQALARVDLSGNMGVIELTPVQRNKYTGLVVALNSMPLQDIGSSRRMGASTTVSTQDGEVGVRLSVTTDRYNTGEAWRVTINWIVPVLIAPAP